MHDHNEKGTTVNHDEHSTEKSSVAMDATLAPVLRAALRSPASSAPSFISRFCARLSGLVLIALLLSLAAGAAPAFADVRAPAVGAESLNPQNMTHTSVGYFSASINSGGAETKWSMEYAAGENGPWSPIPGGTGSVPAERIEAGEHLWDFTIKSGELAGLTPEVTYYVRITVTSVAGSESQMSSFETVPLRPALAFNPQPISNITETAVHLEASIIPRGAETRWRFEYATSEQGPWTAAPGAEGTITKAEADEKYHALLAEITHLNPATVYYVRLFAENEPEPGLHKQATSHPVGFETAGPPTVQTFPVHAIHAGAMRVVGSVGPDGLDTRYHFEYVSQEQFERGGFAGAASTPEVDLGPGKTQIEHGFVRFTTSIVGEDIPGLQPDTTYRYRLTAASAAPGSPVVDGAEQSLVVPVPGPGGEPSCPNTALRGGASAQLPDCRAYEQITPAEKKDAMDVFRYGIIDEQSYIGQDGERFMLHAPGVQWGASPDPSESNYFFSRVSSGWRMTSARPEGEASPDGYEPTAFSSDLTRFGLTVTWSTGYAVKSPEVEFDVGSPGGPYTTVASVPRNEIGVGGGWVAESADGGKLVLAVGDHTLLGAPTGTTSGEDLYEYAEGRLRQVNVLTNGSPISSCGATIAGISVDGAHIVFVDNCTKDLYVRADGAETVDIGPYEFRAANPEGSTLLLEKQSGSGYEFLLYDARTAIAKSFLSTTTHPFRVSASEDLAAVYITSSQQLTPEAPPRSEGFYEAEDIYRYDVASGDLRFVVQAARPGGGDAGGTFASPDGRYFYFSSGGVPGVGGRGSYRYDSNENVVQCIPCSSTFDDEPRQEVSLEPSANGDYVFFDTTSALVPQDVDGEVAPEPIMDSNGEFNEHPSNTYSVSSDVYEWRRNGLDGCAHIQGCLSLITSGRGGFKNVLLGVTPSGSDVFFGTHESLVPQDVDSAGDVYDARIGGGFPPPPPRPVECEGDACSTPFSAPLDATPSSLSFHGAGDVAGEVGAQGRAKAKTKAKHPKAKRKGRAKRKGTRAGAKRARKASGARHAKTIGGPSK